MSSFKRDLHQRDDSSGEQAGTAEPLGDPFISMKRFVLLSKQCPAFGFVWNIAKR
jgi:hypothetical protein